MEPFAEKYAADLAGTLSGFDRLLFRGSLLRLAPTHGMMAYLSFTRTLLKEFGDFAAGISLRIKEASYALAEAQGLLREHLRSPSVNKEERARQIAREHGITQGPVCLFSVVEPGNTFTVRSGGRLRLEPQPRPCLHLYRYAFHPVVGWMGARLQTWFPFYVQVSLNGREWLAQQLDAAHLGYQRRDNCFLQVEDFARAQALLDAQGRTAWPELLDGILRDLHPLHPELFGDFRAEYYWAVQQSEWATDLVFRDPEKLRRLYPFLTRHAVHNLGCGDVLRFFGHRVCAQERPPAHFRGEVVSDLKIWNVGTRMKHRLLHNGVKVYDKAYSDTSGVLRVETTINQPRGFRVYRPKRRTGELAWQPLRKGVADLHRRGEVSAACNERYLKALASADDGMTLQERVQKVTARTQLNGKPVRALRLHEAEDMALLEAVNRGEFVLNGFRNRDLRPLLCGAEEGEPPEEVRRRAGRVTRKLRLLRAHGLIRKIQHSHRYQLTDLGREVITAVLAARCTPVRELLARAA
jgi:hypothetical protein